MVDQMFKSAVFDIDGTICFNGQSIDEEILSALRELRHRTEIVFASARPIRDLLPVLPSDFHDVTLIGGNGAFTRRAGTFEVSGFTDTQRTAIDAAIIEHGVSYLIDGEWDYAFNGPEEHQIFRQLDAGNLASNVDKQTLRTYSKVVLFTSSPQIIDHVKCLGFAVNVHAHENIVDIAPAGINKFQALKRLRVSDSEYVGFGNDSNDEQMLREANVSYRVGDHPSLSFTDRQIAPEQVAHTVLALSDSLK